MKVMFSTVVVALAMVAPMNAMAYDGGDVGIDDGIEGGIEPTAPQIETTGDQDIATAGALNDCATRFIAGGAVLGTVGTGIAGAGAFSGNPVVLAGGGGVALTGAALAVVAVAKSGQALMKNIEGIGKNAGGTDPKESNAECNSIAAGEWWSEGWMGVDTLVATNDLSKAQINYLYAIESNHVELGDALRAADVYQNAICVGHATESQRATVEAEWNEWLADNTNLRTAFSGLDREVTRFFRKDSNLANYVVTKQDIANIPLDEALAAFAAQDSTITQQQLTDVSASFKSSAAKSVGQTNYSLWKVVRADAMRDHSTFWGQFILPGV